MKLYVFLLLTILLLPVVVAVDNFEKVSLIDKMNRLPDEVVNRCSEEVDAGLSYIEGKVDARLEGIPSLIAVMVSTAVIIGSVLGNGLSLFIFKSSYVRRLKSISALRRDLSIIRKDLDALKNDLKNIKSCLKGGSSERYK